MSYAVPRGGDGWNELLVASSRDQLVNLRASLDVKGDWAGSRLAENKSLLNQLVQSCIKVLDSFTEVIPQRFLGYCLLSPEVLRIELE